MNKIITVLLFFFCSNIGAQHSLPTVQPSKENIVSNQQDVIVDTARIEIKPFAPNFKKKYDSPEFIYEFKTPEKNAWDRFKEWLAHFFKKLFSFSSTKTASGFVDILITLTAVTVVISVIYMIVKAIMNNEGQWIFGKNSDKKIIQYDDIEKNLHLADFEKLIQSSLQSGEKRLTTRYYYLWLLKKMADKQIIEWDVEKTNSDYLYEIKDQSQKEDFAYLSYLYNNIWYGEFELDDSTFIKTQTAFEKTIKKVTNG